MTCNVHIGHGIDVHPFVQDRPLILGGVQIPYKKGLAGHSDADVVSHAIMDALLGAAGLSDIGIQFPNTNPAYRNISSIILLERVVDLITKHKFHIVNIDVTVIAEEPQITPYKAAMRQTLANTLKIPENSVSIKATTSEKMGFIGRKEGIMALATALIGF
jgi:2-C-methyl-D-erythritol 2,4-cyclodiphosphate synthase